MKNNFLNKFVISISVLTMLTGAVGMLFCLEQFWNAEGRDITMAGLPCIGGAILFGLGLVSLSIGIKNQ